MAKKHKPRAGSIAFYPRKRAAKQTPSIKLIQIHAEETKPLNFIGYKAGMTTVLGVNAHKGSASFGQEIAVPATIIECPALKVLSVRAYEKTPYGSRIITEVNTEKVDKHLARKIKSFKKKHKEGKETKAKTMADLEKEKERISEIRLICYTQPYLTGTAKKKPDVFELGISGDPEGQLAYAKEKLGNDIKVSELFKEKEFIDIKAVTKGKGIQGPVKRFGIKIQPRKAKKRRIVGSISPWNPSTVMWTVPRAGQMGYHNRTEYNKRILMISSDANIINPASGFKNYGLVKSEFVILAGSVAGPAKRAIAFRNASRKNSSDKFNIVEIKEIPSVIKVKKEETKEEKKEEVKAEEKPKETAAKKEEPKAVEEKKAAVKEEVKETKEEKKEDKTPEKKEEPAKTDENKAEEKPAEKPVKEKK